MMDISCSILLSLTVATFTLSHVIAGVYSTDEAEASWSLIVREHDACVGSSWWMCSRNEHWYGSSGGGVDESLVVAMSSSRISISGVFGPVGWWDTASAALC